MGCAVGSGFGIGDPVDSARVLLAFGVVTAVCVLVERDVWRMEPDASDNLATATSRAAYDSVQRGGPYCSCKL